MTHTSLTLSTIVSIIEYDMKHVTFTLGNVLLQQVDGIPMGGFISAPEAQASCIYAEVQFHSSLGADSHFISAIRYMDDLWVNIPYHSSLHYSQERVIRIMSALKHAYDVKLQLEEQPVNDDNSRYFLETIVRTCGNKIAIEPYRKNADHIRLHGCQTIFTTQYFT